MADTGVQKYSELIPFVVDGVERPASTPIALGTGSYGTVEKLDMKGLECAGKKMHEAIINLEADIMYRKFVEEVRLMRDLRHPNIVQFLGICFLPDSPLPVIVMELLQTNLDVLLEKKLGIPLQMKWSILHDVAIGLTYLHKRSPPIIHRDLTARNVLLNSAMVAKIADFGNSRIVDPHVFVSTMTQAPGTAVYLPPEALSEHPVYDSSIDSFAFGQLALFTFGEDFPRPLPSTYVDEHTDKVMPRTEVERRKKYIDELAFLFEKFPPIEKLIVECLSNSPKKRPSAEDIGQVLENLQTQHPDPYTEMNRLQLIKTIEELTVTGNREWHEKAVSKTEDAETVSHSVMLPFKSVYLCRYIQSLTQMEEMESLYRSKDKLLEAKEKETWLQAEMIKKAEEESKLKDQIIESRDKTIAEKLKEVEIHRDEVELQKTQLKKLAVSVCMYLYSTLHYCNSLLQEKMTELESLCELKSTILKEKEVEARHQANLLEGKIVEVKNLSANLQVCNRNGSTMMICPSSYVLQ